MEPIRVTIPWQLTTFLRAINNLIVWTTEFPFAFQLKTRLRIIEVKLQFVQPNSNLNQSRTMKHGEV